MAERPAPRPLLALLAVVPLALVGGALALGPAPATDPAQRATTSALPGASSSQCAGPLQISEELIGTSGDEELAATAPAEQAQVGALALESDSSLLFGTVAGSETRRGEDGSARAPQLSLADPEGAALDAAVGAGELGASLLAAQGVTTASAVTAETADEGRPVADAVQSTLTAEGDYRSLAVSRCAAASTSASFLGASTLSGSSAELVLRNPTARPATASVQVRTEDGPAAMEGRSQVVVAPGAEERVLLESVIGEAAVLGVEVEVLGAPLAMHVQSTERDGLTPGGAEILTPLEPAGTEQVIPSVVRAGSDPTLVLGNASGEETTAAVRVLGAGGEELSTTVEVPADAVTAVPLEGLPDGAHSVQVEAEDPVRAVVRSEAAGQDLPGDTIGTPVDFALAPAAATLDTSGVTALPAGGGRGTLSLTATADTAATVIPLAADGTAGEPVELEVTADALSTLDTADLRIGDQDPSGLVVVPDLPGVLHVGWMESRAAADDGAMLSALAVLPAQDSGEAVEVRLED